MWNLHTSFVSTISPTDTRPTLLQLTHLVTPSGKTVRIIKSIAAKWKVVGIHLNFDPTGNTIVLIGTHHPLDPEACCTEMMMEWLGGRGRQPANWATLVRVLRDAEFSALAGDAGTSGADTRRTHSTAAHSPGHSLWKDNEDHQIHRHKVEGGCDSLGL